VKKPKKPEEIFGNAILSVVSSYKLVKVCFSYSQLEEEEIGGSKFLRASSVGCYSYKLSKERSRKQRFFGFASVVHLWLVKIYTHLTPALQKS